MFLGTGAANANQIILSKEKPDLHMPFYGAAERKTSTTGALRHVPIALHETEEIKEMYHYYAEATLFVCWFL